MNPDNFNIELIWKEIDSGFGEGDSDDEIRKAILAKIPDVDISQVNSMLKNARQLREEFINARFDQPSM
ncbi:hypothetical protein [Neisseria bacilliformis]|jgi:hypothetical protein|uniref:Uncharacterized protein n=1 Tax=Neisseria bacilliformis ATCC BAA-1200 TaxID=888742 RepID=F2BEC0_9NEIS|nr:hypothetical protein [Neisseria bacilliformis]EGF10201.1 hypothetical protein HMPREF9123_2076 [Neisseria bacilliformis ATCC BAA-1200]QMT46783.1 hypothetical protein H3L91_07450 [Neisseria bacilliformis]